jgi:DNA mismatch repair protein MutS2
MVYPDDFEKKIGFDKIRELIKENCLSSIGKKKVDDIKYSVSYEIIQEKLNETAELKEICINESGFPVNYYFDIIPCLERLKVEGTYPDTGELFDLKRSYDTVGAIVKFFRDHRDKSKYAVLRNMALEVKLHPRLTERIDAILTKDGKIKDSASPALEHIRKGIKQKQAIVGRQLQVILKSAIDMGYVEPDTKLSMRDGRHVIPVPASCKRMIRGFIHDESASGKTSFVEPAEIVELNNEIKELEYEERREIIRILTGFADFVRPFLDDLLLSYDFLGTMDFTRAKALASIKIHGVRPAFIDTCEFRWTGARHPLLLLSHKKEGREVVPLDINLSNKNRILLISGPNAGGKSVCLKTVGLLQYMLQCGLLVPLSENSEAGIYKDIFIDIGDEQSLENDLSTYSSHLLNMKYFIKNAGDRSLVLIDELGSGTEPLLGGAIAEAILDALNKNKTFGVATTHYTNLKHYASSAEGIINGAMLFDTGRMQPLFRLQIGRPGSSFALDIARQIGLPEKIIKNASERIGQDHIKLDRYLRDILRDRKYWEDKRSRIKTAEKKLEQLIEEYSGELNDTRKIRKEIIDRARRDAEDILAGANSEIEKAIKVIRESQAEKERTRKARKDFEEYRRSIKSGSDAEDLKIEGKLGKLRKQEHKLRVKLPAKEGTGRAAAGKGPEDSKIKIGDIVKLYEQDIAGEVIDINKDNISVAFGNMIITVKEMKLKRVGSGEYAKYKKKGTEPGISSGVMSERRLSFRSDIDIRGRRADEALDIVRRFVDDAVMVTVREIRILHGKGDGILKSVVRDYLKTVDVVKSFRDEHADRGGAGITVVELDL